MSDLKRTVLREVELVGDLKAYIINSEDVRISQKLLSFVMGLDDNELVMVENEIYCGIIIYKVELITDDYIRQHLFGDKKK